MAWTDTFNDVSWQNGDYLSELKLSQMAANDRWSRDQASVLQLPSLGTMIASPSEYDTEGSVTVAFVGYWRMQLFIDGTSIWESADHTSDTYRREFATAMGNSVLSAISAGTYIDIKLEWKRSTSAGGTYYAIGSRTMLVPKTQIMNYLRVEFWWCLGEGVDEIDSTAWRPKFKDFSMTAYREA